MLRDRLLPLLCHFMWLHPALVYQVRNLAVAEEVTLTADPIPEVLHHKLAVVVRAS